MRWSVKKTFVIGVFYAQMFIWKRVFEQTQERVVKNEWLKGFNRLAKKAKQKFQINSSARGLKIEGVQPIDFALKELLECKINDVKN